LLGPARAISPGSFKEVAFKPFLPLPLFKKKPLKPMVRNTLNVNLCKAEEKAGTKKVMLIC